MEGMLDEERRRTAAPAPIPPDEFDLTNTFDLFDGLYIGSGHASGSGHEFDADNGRPPGMQPEYRDAEAMRQAEEQEDEDFFRDQAPHERNRYVHGEAECDDDDDDDDDGGT